MAVIHKLRRILTKEFPSPDRVSLRDRDGIIGIITSTRFRDMDSMDRLTLLNELLKQHGLSHEEKREIVILVPVTPEEEEARTAMDAL
jgi:hypothetical protein